MELAMNPGEIPQEESAPEKKKSKFGMGFWLVLLFAVIKDITDLLLTLTVALAPLTFFTGLIMNGVLISYFFFIGVKPDTKKVATFLTSSIIEMFPGADVLPMTTINLIVIRALENKRSRSQ